VFPVLQPPAPSLPPLPPNTRPPLDTPPGKQLACLQLVLHQDSKWLARPHPTPSEGVLVPPWCPTRGHLLCPLHRTQLPVRHIAHHRSTPNPLQRATETGRQVCPGTRGAIHSGTLPITSHLWER
jgi:hypothetical protein